MSESPSSLSRLFAEMKRRKVFRVMAVYGAMAFVLLQVADLLAQGMGLPDQVLAVTTFLVLIGLPIAVVLAWAFESTPEGVKRTADAAPEEISEILAQPASKRLPPGLLALAGIVLLFGAWWLGRQGSAPELNLSVPQAEAADFQRIAVLPFEDLGGNAQDDPFLSGIHVDIHGKLMGLSDLRVTALGSVRDYGASEKSAAEIANELSVDYLLRGSVRRAGDQARVNVQLTDVAIGEDIWFDEYDRAVTAENLFAIQSEIARRVADELEATLSLADVQRIDAGLSTDNLAAINAYHRARSMMFGSEAAVHVDDIQGELQRSVELAPEFVEAWSLLAWVRSWSRIYPDQAREAVERTEALAAGTLPAIKARGSYKQYVEEDFEGALELMRQAERLAPSDSEVLVGIAHIQHRLGEFSEGTRTMKRAVQLDPQSTENLVLLSNMLMRQSRWQAARQVVERVLAIDPSHYWARHQLVHLTLQGDGNPDAALALAAEFGLEPTRLHGWIATTDRDYDRAARILASVVVDAGDPSARDNRRNILATSTWVERLRGGDPEPLRDSLAVVLNSDPIRTDPWNLLREAWARIEVGRVAAGWDLWDDVVAEIRVWNDQAGSNSARWVAARIAAEFGKPEQAFALLDEAVGKPADGIWSVPDLTLDPRFDAIRGDPRFDALIARQQAYEDEQAREAEKDGPWLP